MNLCNKIFFIVFLSITMFFINSMNEKCFTVPTSQGNISILDSQSEGPVVLMIHGNSASGKIFSKQFKALGKQFRLIAPDLPGHGNSDLAKDISTYSFPGYARVLAEVVKALNIQKLFIVGWSLGGHIALELLQLLPDEICGIAITGTPPIALSYEGIKKGFKPFEGLHLLGHEPQFTKEEAKIFMGLGGINMETSEETQFILDDAMKAAGIARKNMFEAISSGVGTDETEIVRAMKIPLAIIAGEDDVGINNEYIMDLEYGNLWHKKVQIIKKAGHAIFWENSDEFNLILKQFLIEIPCK